MCISCIYYTHLDGLVGSRSERVTPLQAREPGEVRIGGTEFRSVLDGQGSQMCVRCEISARAQMQEQLPKNREVARTWMHDGSRSLIEPGSHNFESRIHRQWIPKQARPSGETKEGEKNIPRKADGFLSG